jgi:hypothetical protein
MNAVESVKADLLPKLGDLLTHLLDTEQAEAASFFSRVYHALNGVSGEEQLLEVFIELSTTAFLGIDFDGPALALIDDVLLHAEQVAAAFSADTSQPQ